MSVEPFYDTNILVYCFDHTDPVKQAKAKQLVDAESVQWGISWQVIQEFCSVALHRFNVPMATADLEDYLELVLVPHCVVHSSSSIYQQAIGIQKQTQYRFYDSLIVAAAIHAGAKRLVSEDLQHGRKLGGLEIVNPFQ